MYDYPIRHANTNNLSDFILARKLPLLLRKQFLNQRQRQKFELHLEYDFIPFRNAEIKKDFKKL